MTAATPIPKEELERLSISHPVITGAQITLYTKFAKTGKTLTWDAMHDIEVEAL